MPRKPRQVALTLDLQWPYKRHAGVFAGTQRYAREQGWHSIIDEFAHDTLASAQAKSSPYDGIIARANRPLAAQAERLGVPLVNVWANSPMYGRLPGAYIDFRIVGEICAEHLLARGFRNFATLTPLKSLAKDLVFQEFARWVGEAGFKCMHEKIPQDPWRDLANWRRTEQVIEGCLKDWKPPIGVYIDSEGVGRLVVQACHRRGWRVPTDVAIIAGTNEETLCEYPQPALTSVEMDYERVGYEAARLLHQLMDDKPVPKTPVLLPPKGLVVRESTDFIAVEDELVSLALRYIAANSHRPIGQDDVSKAVGAETRTLQNRFRKVLNRPIVTEIRRVRIERAKRELSQSNRRLSEIARDVGFGEVMRMYEVFRRELGVTPSEYRKQRQLEK